MYQTLIVLIIFPVFLTVSCQSTVSTTDNIHYGKVIEADGAVSFVAVMDKLESTDELETKISGTIQTVCKKKGCWITLNEANSGKEDMFVRFEDYGFFLPLDCENRKVIMEGRAFKETTPVDELRHYAEDEGKSQADIAAITEPKIEFKFMATGVKMMN